MLEKFLWDIIDKEYKLQKQQLIEIWKWIRMTYIGELEVHFPNNIWGFQITTFTPVEREYIFPTDNGIVNDLIGDDARLKRKAMHITVDRTRESEFDQMWASGLTFRYMSCTLRKVKNQEIIWVIGMKNAILIKRGQREVGDVRGYTIICQGLNVLVPKKNLEPPPAHLNL